MVFCHKLVFLGLTLALLANSVSGGPVVGTVCVTTCNTVWVACASAATYSSFHTGRTTFLTELALCNTAQATCLQLCGLISLLPTT